MGHKSESTIVMAALSPLPLLLHAHSSPPCSVRVELHTYENSGYHLWNTWYVPGMVPNPLFPIFHWTLWHYEECAIIILLSRKVIRTAELNTLPRIVHLGGTRTRLWVQIIIQGTISQVLNDTAPSYFYNSMAINLQEREKVTSKHLMWKPETIIPQIQNLIAQFNSVLLFYSDLLDWFPNWSSQPFWVFVPCSH